MQYSTLRPTFWARFIQSQEHFADAGDIQSRSAGYPEAIVHINDCPSADCLAEAFPEIARDKFYHSAAAFFAEDVTNALKYAFQALQICSFALGPQHSSVSVIMIHIATICDSQGLNFEAEMMRRGSLKITEEVLKRNAKHSYCH
jgi:hypothetical protein